MGCMAPCIVISAPLQLVRAAFGKVSMLPENLPSDDKSRPAIPENAAWERCARTPHSAGPGAGPGADPATSSAI